MSYFHHMDTNSCLIFSHSHGIACKHKLSVLVSDYIYMFSVKNMLTVRLLPRVKKQVFITIKRGGRVSGNAQPLGSVITQVCG